jgi:hypothetical protein
MRRPLSARHKATSASGMFLRALRQNVIVLLFSMHHDFQTPALIATQKL